MMWGLDTNITPAHVDYFWKQSRILFESDRTNLVIPGFLPVKRLSSPITTVETGPFGAQTCCNTTLNDNFGMGDATLLERVSSVQRREDNTMLALLPFSTEALHGWMMTQRQVGRLLEDCPTFFPTVDRGPQHCSWQSWIDLDPDFFSHHFVQQSREVLTNATTYLSPNGLWKALGEKAET